MLLFCQCGCIKLNFWKSYHQLKPTQLTIFRLKGLYLSACALSTGMYGANLLWKLRLIEPVGVVLSYFDSDFKHIQPIS